MSNKKQTAFEWYIEQHNILVQVCDNMLHITIFSLKLTNQLCNINFSRR